MVDVRGWSKSYGVEVAVQSIRPEAPRPLSWLFGSCVMIVDVVVLAGALLSGFKGGLHDMGLSCALVRVITADGGCRVSRVSSTQLRISKAFRAAMPQRDA